MVKIKGMRTLLALATRALGKWRTIMSVSPVALPKMLLQASFSSGFTSCRYEDGLRYTPNSPSMDRTVDSGSPSTWL